MNKTHKVVGAVMAFLAVFVVYIVWTNYSTQTELREAALYQFRDSSARKANTLGHFFSERRNDLDNLLASREVYSYFENESLGMSREYGLWATLVSVSELFDRFMRLKSLGGHNVYDRIAFVDVGGVVLADNSGAFEKQQSVKLSWKEDSFTFSQGEDGGTNLILQAPIRYEGRRVGSIVAWLEMGNILPVLMFDHQSQEQAEFGFIVHGKTVFSPGKHVPDEVVRIVGGGKLPSPGSVETRLVNEQSGEGMRYLVAVTRIGDTPLLWVSLAPEAEVLGSQPPWKLLLYNVLLAVVLLAGGMVSFMVGERNLILNLKIAEAAVQSETVKEKNRELEREVRARIRVEQALHKVNDELELRVKERTATLGERSEALAKEVQERREAEAAMRVLFNNVRDAIFIYTLSGELVDVNETMLSMFEVSRSEAFLLSFKDISSPDNDFDRLERLWEEALQGREAVAEWEAMRPGDGTRFDAETTLVRMDLGGQPVILASVHDISEQKRIQAQQEEHQEFLNTVFEGIGAAIFVFDPERRELVDCNHVGEALLSLPKEHLAPMSCASDYAFKTETDVKKLLCPDRNDRVSYEEGVLTLSDGTLRQVSRQLFEVHIGGKGHLVQVVFDIAERKNLERKLNVAQKLESIGLLASGIAHEINTPIQYVGDSVRFVKDAFQDLEELIGLYVRSLESSADAGLKEEIEAFREDMDIEFVMEETPKACDRALEGVERVATIVLAMKNFSHPGEEKPSAVDINKAIENTAIVTRNEWKYVADLTTDLAPDLPLVTCFPGGINQVLLNIIVNAAHAVMENVTEGEKGTIGITTAEIGDGVEIRITDSGCGIPRENIAKVFDPFFTTKEVGKGTGQGLAIVHDVIVEKHGGTVDIESEVGVGTTFIIRLPLGRETE
ncbi:MAG: ATP-binding protein [Pseudodesulfovibrio sp.]|uniref:PAS domain-containing sensor histidine kinase n=1 Tax=Pseudodesulfovibrio sp. TaxID=2035812 RepID=UPI003D14188C